MVYLLCLALAPLLPRWSSFPTGPPVPQLRPSLQACLMRLWHLTHSSLRALLLGAFQLPNRVVPLSCPLIPHCTAGVCFKCCVSASPTSLGYPERRAHDVTMKHGLTQQTHVAGCVRDPGSGTLNVPRQWSPKLVGFLLGGEGGRVPRALIFPLCFPAWVLMASQ